MNGDVVDIDADSFFAQRLEDFGSADPQPLRFQLNDVKVIGVGDASARGLNLDFRRGAPLIARVFKKRKRIAEG